MPVNSFENYPMSWKPVLGKNSRHLYKELAKQLEEDIINGVLLPGTKLPPQRELADFLDINASTVTKAFKVCTLKGLLSSSVGRGTYISYDAVSNTYLLKEGNDDKLIEMGATLPDSTVNKDILELLQKMITEPDASRWLSYNSPGGSDWQKEAAKRYLHRCGLESDVSRILLTNGGQNALTAILAGLFKYGDRIGVDTHVYPGIKTAASMLGINLIPIHQKNREMDGGILLQAIQKDKLKGIYAIPAYQNPTAHTMSLETRKAIADAVKKKEIIIIEDGTYQLLGKPIPPIGFFAPENTIYIAGLSKAVAPGLRMAYVACPEVYKNRIAAAVYNLNVSVSPIMAELAARISASDLLDSIMNKHKKETIARNELTVRYLGKWGCMGDETCIFRWLRLPGHISGTFFEERAKSAGVQVYAAERFVVGNAVPDHAVRISVCAPESREELEKGLIILKKLLKEME